MTVKKYQVKTLYEGNNIETMCKHHSDKIESIILSNAEKIHFNYIFKAISNEFQGQCIYCNKG